MAKRLLTSCKTKCAASNSWRFHHEIWYFDVIGVSEHAMNNTKVSAFRPTGAGAMTLLTFVRAARFVSLLLAAVCSIEFVVLAIVWRDATALSLGLVLLVAMTLAAWISAAVLGAMLLIPRWLWTTWRKAVQTKRWASTCSSVWDQWLDVSI
jgi:hypothetical protein